MIQSLRRSRWIYGPTPEVSNKTSSVPASRRKMAPSSRLMEAANSGPWMTPQEKRDAWQLDYIRHLPHSALPDLALDEFAETCRKNRAAFSRKTYIPFGKKRGASHTKSGKSPSQHLAQPQKQPALRSFTTTFRTSTCAGLVKAISA